MHKFSEINFLDLKKDKKYVDLIERVIRQVFIEEKIDNINLYVNIILTTPENIRNINKKYRDIDRETDVLSFPMFEKNEIEGMITNGNDIEEPLGDIVISMKKVEEQAKEYKHSFERELSYMLVHGFYHLMGYDHMEDEEKKQMREKEELVLNKLKITR